MMVLSAHDFQNATNVSRETQKHLERYAERLTKWQNAINLVSKTTLNDLWSRHFLDSAQLYPLVTQHFPAGRAMVDLGSGAGFPGLVLAIMGVENVHLVEADRRKSLFLKEVARLCDVSVTVHDCRIEECQIDNIGMITARALASLSELFEYGAGLVERDTSESSDQHAPQYLFLKGAKTEEEISSAQKNWTFGYETMISETDENAKILRCFDVLALK